MVKAVNDIASLSKMFSTTHPRVSSTKPFFVPGFLTRTCKRPSNWLVQKA